MAASEQSIGGQIYQLKVTLKGSKPPIWRRFQVPADITLHRLHLILQAVMGWANYHLYRFEIAGKEYGDPDPDNDFYELDFRNSRRAKLAKVAPQEKAKFTYEYDFGDSWNHEILVEKILPTELGSRYPICIAGKRACPPEDCGGIWGYADLLNVIQNRRHKRYREMMEWLGGCFDPERFDLDIVNLRLKTHWRRHEIRGSRPAERNHT